MWLLSSHSVVSDSATPWTASHQASLSFTISQSLCGEDGGVVITGQHTASKGTGKRVLTVRAKLEGGWEYRSPNFCAGSSGQCRRL